MSRVHGEVERSSACTGQACLAQIVQKGIKTKVLIKNKNRNSM